MSSIESASRSGSLRLVPFSEIHPRPVNWLWRHRVPMGQLTVLAGIQGVGKSFLTIDMAARVTTGGPWPDAAPAPSAGSVIFLADEDDGGEAIRPRLDLAGADVSRVHLLVAQGRSIVFPGVQAEVEDMARELGDVRMIVCDPLDAFLKNGCDENANADVRPLIESMKDLAARTGAAVVGVRHTRKAEAGAAVHRVAGARVWTSIPRMVWGVGTDRQSSESRVLVNVKANLKSARPLRFRIADENDIGRLEWIAGEVAGDAASDFASDNAATAFRQRGHKRRAAESILQERLANGGKLKLSDLPSLATGTCSFKTLQRAARQLGLVEHRGWLKMPTRAAG